MNATSVAPDLSRHPCFNESAKGVCGRVHLPVAPRCNIKCNYCDRRYDCVNESRPGVTSSVLAPGQALRYVERVLERDPRIAVVGIAGPGDPLGNPEETLETVRLIRQRFPELLLCLSTNGLALPAHADTLAELGVSHVTVTVNAVDPDVGQRIYAWAREGKVIYRGRQAAERLLERQLSGIAALKSHGVIVKVNTIVIPGVNEEHVEDIARAMAGLRVDVLNCMAMVPVTGTPFEAMPEPAPGRVAELRGRAAAYLPQMKHCRRCRADAVGLLEEDRSAEFRSCLEACASELTLPTRGKPYVAVASLEGMLVNQHLGEAGTFQIWAEGSESGSCRLVEERQAPLPGGGVDRWRALAEVLSDCRAVLVSGVGEAPRAILTEAGVPPLEVSGFIDLVVPAILTGRDAAYFRQKRSGGCSKGLGGCKGDGAGCG
ncbi:MAG: nitrogenase cofactor biosynthesis protein NifB [Deltaproteobacteria bacterium]|nr:nitrogenase cofactor biosynthesis protein NifB [Deltaproteobacteria bacterium]